MGAETFMGVIRRGGRIHRAGILLVLSLLSLSLQADDLEMTPMLRVETGHHIASISTMVVDQAHNRLFSASYDKTIRVWQMPEGRLTGTYRVPIGPGSEGMIFSIALSPDGQTLVAGGWTGWSWERKGSLYVLDASNGEIKQRLHGFPEVVGALRYTPDGKYLAVGLMGANGVRILRTTDYKEVAQDIQYADKVLSLDFDSQGRMLSSSVDGFLRLYDASFKLIGRKKTGLLSSKLSDIRFSPDGKLVAVCFFDVPLVSVLSAADLSLLYNTSKTGITDQVNLSTIAWSHDGNYLYAGGDYRGKGESPIYRWSQQGRGSLRRASAAQGRIGYMVPLPGGKMAYAAEDPAIGVLELDGKKSMFLASDIADFRFGYDALRVSIDGSIVQFPYRQGGQHSGFFSVPAKSLLSRSAPTKGLQPPLMQAPEFKVEGWKNSYQPVINGKPLTLDDYEMARSYAITPDRSRLLMGTEWALRLYDREANLKWITRVPSVAWLVNITGDGKLVVAALSDGTIRWYRLEDGVEMFAFFPHKNETDWVAWIPQGYYMSSTYGDQYVGWHMNRSKDETPDFYRAVQFERVLYRPDVVVSHFKARGQLQTRSLEQFDIMSLREIAPPRIRIQSFSVENESSAHPVLNMKFTAEKTRLPMKDYTVFVNNIPITTTEERGLGRSSSSSLIREVRIRLSATSNTIRIEVFNGRSLGVSERYVHTPNVPGQYPKVGNLYLLAVGVNQFPKLHAKVRLAYAAQDAEALASQIHRMDQGYYKNVYTRLLSDNTDKKPTRQEIIEALRFIQRAQGDDTVIVFLASHGISDVAGSYYFVPQDAEMADVDSVLKGRAGAERPSLIEWTTLFDALRATAGYRVLVVDTCQAKNIEGRFDANSLVKHSASSLFAFVLASKGSEDSQEYPSGKHGLFTYALLEGFKGKADHNLDGLVSVNELFKFTAPLVEKLRDRSIGPQTPQFIAPESLTSFPLIGGIRH